MGMFISILPACCMDDGMAQDSVVCDDQLVKVPQVRECQTNGGVSSKSCDSASAPAPDIARVQSPPLATTRQHQPQLDPNCWMSPNS